MGKPDLGTIEPGKFADIIVVPGDPVYHNLNNLFTVQAVLKNGIVYKIQGKPTVKMPE
jgi:imidazolonepropionase-like amidohydrolase